MSEVIIIVQARMGSKRLPGKSLIDIAGKPLIGHLFDSLVQALPIDQIFLATTSLPEDFQLGEYIESKGISIHFGDSEDVASRYCEILENNPAEYFFRVCGDTPLYDYRLIEQGLSILNRSGKKFDFVTSMPNRGFPMGMNIELFNSEIFLKGYSQFSKRNHFEHVTNYFYDNKDNYAYLEERCNLDNYEYSRYKFSVDTQDDLNRIRKIYDYLQKDHYAYSFAELVEIYNKVNIKS